MQSGKGKTMARTAIWWTSTIGGGALALGLLTACSGQVDAHWSGQENGSTANQPNASVANNSGGSGSNADSDSGSGTGLGTGSNPGSGSGSGSGKAGTTSSVVPRCHTADLSARLSTVATHEGGSSSVNLVYTNTSSHTCTMDGFGGVDLHGPADPNGPVDSLRRDPDVQGRDAARLPKPALVRLAPGGTAHTLITFEQYTDGDIGTAGSTNWVPTSVVSTPPDETSQLTTSWPTGVSVLRLDGATIEHTFISPIKSGNA